jgi:hypothetical protein
MTKPSLTKIELGVFFVWSIRHLGVLLLTCACLAAALHAQAGAGAIVVSSDEWVFDDSVIDDLCCQDTRFAMNIAGFLVPCRWNHSDPVADGWGRTWTKRDEA